MKDNFFFPYIVPGATFFYCLINFFKIIKNRKIPNLLLIIFLLLSMYFLNNYFLENNKKSFFSVLKQPSLKLDYSILQNSKKPLLNEEDKKLLNDEFDFIHKGYKKVLIKKGELIINLDETENKKEGFQKFETEEGVYFSDFDDLTNSLNLFYKDFHSENKKRVFNKRFDFQFFLVHDYLDEIILINQHENQTVLKLISDDSVIFTLIENKIEDIKKLKFENDEINIFTHNRKYIFEIKNKPETIISGEDVYQKLENFKNFLYQKEKIYVDFNLDIKNQKLEIKTLTDEDELSEILKEFFDILMFFTYCFRNEFEKNSIEIYTEFFKEKISVMTKVDLLSRALDNKSYKLLLQNINIKINESILRFRGGV
ncbi:MAG: hypothetical protein ACQESP_04105 [Candidatus Muiribacteriota bacterium]